MGRHEAPTGGPRCLAPTIGAQWASHGDTTGAPWRHHGGTDAFYDRGSTFPLKRCRGPLTQNRRNANLDSKMTFLYTWGHGTTHRSANRFFLRSVFGRGIELFK